MGIASDYVRNKLQLFPGDIAGIKYFFEVMGCKSCTSKCVGAPTCLCVFVAVNNEELDDCLFCFLSTFSPLSSPLSVSVPASYFLFSFFFLNFTFQFMLDIFLVQKVISNLLPLPRWSCFRSGLLVC